MRFDSRNQRQRLGVQFPGVQRGDGDVEAARFATRSVMHHVLGAEAARLHDAPRMLHGGGLSTIESSSRAAKPSVARA